MNLIFQPLGYVLCFLLERMFKQLECGSLKGLKTQSVVMETAAGQFRRHDALIHFRGVNSMNLQEKPYISSKQGSMQFAEQTLNFASLVLRRMR